MSKKHKTQWDGVPKDQRGKVIRQGIAGAFTGFLGVIPNIPEENEENEGNEGNEEKSNMYIRKSEAADVPRMMEIYAYARDYMAKTGNPNQWGPTGWPPEELIREDIHSGNSYVCLNEQKEVIGTFYFIQGVDIEPTYREITDGAWMDDSSYGVVHRIAADGSQKGIGEFCLRWAFDQCGHMRIDTHGDNVPMQRLLEKLGFTRCGTIYVLEDDYPRFAYEKVMEG